VREVDVENDIELAGLIKAMSGGELKLPAIFIRRSFIGVHFSAVSDVSFLDSGFAPYTRTGRKALPIFEP
jgi:hypothetical protein